MNATRKVKLNDISANLTCKLCMGYLVEATTIIECLHSFCKSCIIKYLEKSADLEEKYFCPICEIQLHETKPLTSLRSDLMLQEIVYKLVPGLFKNEMSRRREYYEQNETSTPTNQLDSGQVFDELYITSDDIIHLSLEYVTEDLKLRETTKRYLKCPAAVSVCILKKFIQGKYDLELGTSIDIMFGDRILPDDFLLMDVAYKYSWTMNGSKPLTLRYRIKGPVKPVIIPEKTINDSLAPPDTVKTAPATTDAQKKKVCNENGSNIMPSNEIKNNLIKMSRNGLISGEVTIAPIIKPPNSKLKNKKRKHISYTDIVIDVKDDMKNIAKRLKLPKPDSKSQPSSNPYQSAATVELIPASEIIKKSGDIEVGKEVQLQISENGVMSARSVSFSGNEEEKILFNQGTTTPSASTSKSSPSPTTSQNINLTEKLLLSGNFHSKTGPSGVTEIICDKPDPSTEGLKPIAKPGYVTLNIPNPQNINSQRNLSSTNLLDKTKKLPVTNLLESPSPSPTSMIRNGKPQIEIKVSDKPSNTSLLEKIKNKIAAKGKDEENVIKAINDLGKRCNSSSTNGSSTHGSLGSPKIPGLHSHPMISTLSSHLQPPSKVKGQNGFPFPLNFPPSSGMSVSMIPCTATSTNGMSNNDNSNNNSLTRPQSTTPPRRVSHQTTVVNGDLKFTTSPKQPTMTNGDQDTPPKKPPKFFKSRHTVSPGGQKSSSPHRPEIEIKRKTPIHMGNGSLEPPKKKMKEKSESQKSLSSNQSSLSHNLINSRGLQSASSFSAVSTTNGKDSTRPIPFPSQSTESIFSQQLKAMNGISSSSIPSTEALNASFGIAAAAAVAAANGNGVRPFLHENYASMPYGYGSLLSQFILPQYYNNPINFPGLGTPSNSISTMSLNLNKSKPSNSPPLVASQAGNGSRILNGLLSSVESKSDTEASTLDLSVNKTGESNSDKSKLDKEESDRHPLLSLLLTSKDAKKDCPTSTTDKAKALVSPSARKIVNGKEMENKKCSTSPREANKKDTDQASMASKTPSKSEPTQNNVVLEKVKEEKMLTPSSNNVNQDEPGESGTKKDELDSNKSSHSSNLLPPTGNISSTTTSLDAKLLSQNNNNHAPETIEKEKATADSITSSAETKIKMSLERANQLKEDKKNCNGNNNGPAVTVDTGSNSGSG